MRGDQVTGMQRVWRHVAMAALLIGATGCYQAPVGLHYEDTRRFQQRPHGSYRIAPVARVDETLYGLNILGIAVRPLKPEVLQDKYLKDQTLYLTNWQVLTAVIDIPYVQFLFNMPYARVIFDVVRVEDQGS